MHERVQIQRRDFVFRRSIALLAPDMVKVKLLHYCYIMDASTEFWGLIIDHQRCMLIVHITSHILYLILLTSCEHPATARYDKHLG